MISASSSIVYGRANASPDESFKNFSNFVRRVKQLDQIELDSANQSCSIGIADRRELLLFQLGEHKPIDVAARPTVGRTCLLLSTACDFVTNNSPT